MQKIRFTRHKKKSAEKNWSLKEKSDEKNADDSRTSFLLREPVFNFPCKNSLDLMNG